MNQKKESLAKLKVTSIFNLPVLPEIKAQQTEIGSSNINTQNSNQKRPQYIKLQQFYTPLQKSHKLYDQQYPQSFTRSICKKDTKIISPQSQKHYKSNSNYFNFQINQKDAEQGKKQKGNNSQQSLNELFQTSCPPMKITEIAKNKFININKKASTPQILMNSVKQNTQNSNQKKVCLHNKPARFEIQLNSLFQNQGYKQKKQKQNCKIKFNSQQSQQFVERDIKPPQFEPLKKSHFFSTTAINIEQNSEQKEITINKPSSQIDINPSLYEKINFQEELFENTSLWRQQQKYCIMLQSQIKTNTLYKLKKNPKQLAKLIINSISTIIDLKLNLADLASNKIFSVQPFENKQSKKFIYAAKRGDLDTLKEQLKINPYIVHDFDFVFYKLISSTLYQGTYDFVALSRKQWAFCYLFFFIKIWS